MSDVIRRRGPSIAVLVALATTVALVGCAPAPVRVDLAEVRIDDEPWVVLIAGPDGMRGLEDFGGTDGMLFDQGRDVPPGAIVFVMDGVSIPLDIAWFDDEGRLVGIEAMTVCEAEPCPRYAAPGPFRWAIEAEPGAFDHLPDDALLLPGELTGELPEEPS